MDNFRSVYVMSETQMSDWNMICKAFAKRENAKLLFVNNISCGIEYPNGNLVHVTIEGMMSYLGGGN